jgi:hypothetical protein
MLYQLLNEADFSVHNRCTKHGHTSPNTMISPTHQYSNLLKTHVPQIAERTTNQKVGSSNPPGRTISPIKTHVFETGRLAVRYRFTCSLPAVYLRSLPAATF